MIFFILAACSLQSSFLCIPQILCCLVYLYLAIRIDIPFYAAKIYLSYFVLFYTTSILLTKMVLSVLVATDYYDESVLIQSFGILIQSDILRYEDIMFTYACDSVTLFIFPLFIQRNTGVKNSEKENPEKYERFLKTCKDVYFYYPALITITILVSMLS